MTESKSTRIAADIVLAYICNNAVSVAELPALIRATGKALDAIAGQEASKPPEPSVKADASQIRKSVTPEALISFENGLPYRTLKRHLAKCGLTVAEYKAKWGLPDDYPTTASAYSEMRSAMAKAIGLGKGGRPRRRDVSLDG